MQKQLHEYHLFPVDEPTIKTGFPGPLAVAEIRFLTFITPAEKAFTKDFDHNSHQKNFT